MRQNLEVVCRGDRGFEPGRGRPVTLPDDIESQKGSKKRQKKLAGQTRRGTNFTVLNWLLTMISFGVSPSPNLSCWR